MKLLTRSIVSVFAVLGASCHMVWPDENRSGIGPKVSNASIGTSQFQEQWCSFELSEKNVETYFSVAEKVDTHEFNTKAVIAPCYYEGTVTIDGVTSQWRLYAGGAAYLYAVAEGLDKRYLCKRSCRDLLPALE